MPTGSEGQGGVGTPSTDGGMVSNQMAMLVPGFDPSSDDVSVWSGKVALLLTTWPKDKLNELATRLILGCKGSMFLKLQLNRTSILTGTEKGIQRLVELVGGSFGQVPLEKKFELAEKALFKCHQKSDESSDSYLSRCDVVWSELLARNMKLEELQAFILLRGSKLTADDKKRVIVDSGGETSGVLEISKVTAAVRMLGSGFFLDMSGQKRDRTQKVYDQNAFAVDEVEDQPDAETYMAYDETYDEENLEVLAMDYQDEDAALILQFEDALMETINADSELSTFYTSYQDARKRLADRQKSRGFWPIKRSFDKGGKKGYGKGKKGKQSLAQRISNSYCRICYKRGHWKDECPERNKHASSSSVSQSSTVAPTSFVMVEEIPAVMQDLPFEPSESSNQAECLCNFGETIRQPQTSANNIGKKFSLQSFREKVKCGMHHRLSYLKHPDGISRSVDRRVETKTPSPKVVSNQKFPVLQTEVCDSYFASTGSIGVVDLGASQTVIGDVQVSELLSKLPESVRQQVKRTHCNLVFRFGNHQTLPSRHALLLPLQGSWFQIAVVKGNTPFLLSSNFLRKTIQAVIDTDQGTLWSKRLKKALTIDITPKNLFLLDINQLWEDREQSVNLETSLLSTSSDHVGLKPMDNNPSVVEKQAEMSRQSLSVGSRNELKSAANVPRICWCSNWQRDQRGNLVGDKVPERRNFGIPLAAVSLISIKLAHNHVGQGWKSITPRDNGEHWPVHRSTISRLLRSSSWLAFPPLLHQDCVQVGFHCFGHHHLPAKANVAHFGFRRIRGPLLLHQKSTFSPARNHIHLHLHNVKPSIWRGNLGVSNQVLHNLEYSSTALLLAPLSRGQVVGFDGFSNMTWLTKTFHLTNPHERNVRHLTTSCQRSHPSTSLLSANLFTKAKLGPCTQRALVIAMH